MSAAATVVSVVIPVTDSDIDIQALCQGYGDALARDGYSYEIVFVLDGLHGRIVQRFEETVGDDEHVKLVRLQGNGFGESIALSAGVNRANGSLIVNAPQYLQIEPDDIIRVVKALESGADFVATWRNPRVDPWLNRLQSRTFNWLLRFVLGVKFNDLNSSLRGMRRQVLEDVALYGDMYRFLPVLAHRRGFRVVEVKVRHREEKGRRGFYGVGVYLRRLLDILAITFLTRFTQKPLRFFGLLGSMSILIGFALCIRPLWLKFSVDDTLLDKPIIVLGVTMIAFGVQLIGFGLVGEIIIFTQARSMRDYKIDEAIGGVEDLDADIAFGAVSAELGDDDVPLRVRELLPGEDARWDAWVRRHPQGTFFHLTGWRRVVEETFGHEPHYLVAEQGRSWLGVLPLMYTRSPLVGNQIVSVPYGVYGGVLSTNDLVNEQLFIAARQIGDACKAKRIELRHLEARVGARGSSEQRDLYVTFRRDLPAKVEDVMPSIPKKARAEVRRAIREHDMQFGVSNDIATFHDLFARDKKRLGSPALPIQWFRGLVEEFGDQVVIHQASLPTGEVTAMVMSFVFNDTLYAYYSGSAFTHFKSGVNNFIYCRIMEWCVERGLKVFDFGRSRSDSGVVGFKKRMGFEAEPLAYEYLLLQGQEGALPEFHPSNPRLSGPRQIWARLPVALTNRLSGRLSRYLP